MLHEFNKLMDYIETHITEGISGKDISKIVGISDYHFKRMFSYMAGLSLNEYIKNRRLSLANVELINGEKVTDVAYKYGYQSVEGFSRAFREWSGFLPSEVAKNNIQKSFPKFTFYIDIRGGISMEFKIEKKEKFNIVGVSKRVPIQFEGENNAIVELAKTITEQQRKEMHELADLYPHQVLNVSYDFDDGYLEEKGFLTHMIGFATTKENPFADLKQITIEESL
jgi:AraC family transcriptional regulator